MNSSKNYLEAEAIEDLMSKMAKALEPRLEVIQSNDPAMIGIHTGGAWLTEHLHKTMDAPEGSK